MTTPTIRLKDLLPTLQHIRIPASPHSAYNNGVPTSTFVYAQLPHDATYLIALSPLGTYGLFTGTRGYANHSGRISIYHLQIDTTIYPNHVVYVNDVDGNRKDPRYDSAIRLGETIIVEDTSTSTVVASFPMQYPDQSLLTTTDSWYDIYVENYLGQRINEFGRIPQQELWYRLAAPTRAEAAAALGVSETSIQTIGTGATRHLYPYSLVDLGGYPVTVGYNSGSNSYWQNYVFTLPSNTQIPMTAIYPNWNNFFVDSSDSPTFELRDSFRVSFATSEHTTETSVINVMVTVNKIPGSPSKSAADGVAVRNLFRSIPNMQSVGSNYISSSYSNPTIHNVRVNNGVTSSTDISYTITPPTMTMPTGQAIVRFERSNIDYAISTVDTVAPSSPASGDLWYDTATNEFKVYDGTSFTSTNADVNQTFVSDDQPASTKVGDQWFNPTTGQLKIYTE